MALTAIVLKRLENSLNTKAVDSKDTMPLTLLLVKEELKHKRKTLSQSARIIADKDLDTGKIYVFMALMDRKAPSKIIYEMYNLHHQHNFVRMGFEENLFRDLFIDHIESVKTEWRNNNGFEIKLPWYSVWADQKKEQRIYSIEPIISQGKMLFSKHLSPDFLTQLQDYPNCDHNDGLDALEILAKISNPNMSLKSFNLSHLVKKQRNVIP